MTQNITDASDAVIEAVARRLFESYNVFSVTWEKQGDELKNDYRCAARDLAEAGLLADELRAERGRLAARIVELEQCRDRALMRVSELAFERDEAWHRIPELEESRLALIDQCRDYEARIADLEQAGAQAIDADELAQALIDSGRIPFDGEFEEVTARDCANVIREHLPAATRLALPENHIALDMSRWGEDSLHDLSESRPDSWTSMAGVSIAATAARAELARRAAELPERTTP